MKKLAALEVPWRPIDAIVAFLLAWIGAPIAIVYGLKLTSPYVPVFNAFLVGLRGGGIEVSFIFAVINGLVTLSILALYLRKYTARWRDLGWKKFNVFKAALYIVLAFVLFIASVEAAFWLVTYVFPQFNANQAQTNEFTSPTSSTARTLSLIALVALPPVIEETLFRGFIFPALSKWGGVVVGAVLTSLMFGFAHLQYNVGLYTIILSLILCAMYYRLRSIWPGVLLHMINNYIAFMANIK